MKPGFLEKLIGRLGRIGPEEVQNYLLRLAQEKGFLETIFNSIQEGIIVTDSNGRITYLNDAACEIFGLDGENSIGKRLDERVRGLDWKSLSQTDGALSRDMEIFYPANRFINFYIVPLMIERRDADEKSKRRSAEYGGPRHDPARHHREPSLDAADDRVGAFLRADSARGGRGARDRQSAQFAPHPSAIDGAESGKLEGKARRASCRNRSTSRGPRSPGSIPS